MLDPFCGCATTCIAAESLQRQWIGIDISPKAIELLKLRLERELHLTEDTSIFGQVVHLTTPPKRTDPIEPRQIHLESLLVLKILYSLKIYQSETFGVLKPINMSCLGCKRGSVRGVKSLSISEI